MVQHCVRYFYSHRELNVAEIKRDRQCTYNSTLRRVRVTIVAVEKQ
jgi:hypothetical protein